MFELAVLAVCFSWVLIFMSYYFVFSWWIAGDLDGTTGALGLIGLTSLGAIAATSTVPSLQIGVFFVLFFTIALYPVVMRYADKRTMARLDRDHLEQAYGLLRINPRNAAARLAMARTCYHRGLLGNAVGILEHTLAGMNPTLFMEEHRALKAWRTHLAQQGVSPTPCLECGHASPPHEPFCAQCGAPFLLDYVGGKRIKAAAGPRIVVSWVLAAGCIFGIVMAMNYDLTPGLKAAAIICLTVLGAVGVVLAMRPFFGGPG